MTRIAIAIFATALILFSCNKENRTMNTYFYSSNTDGAALSLFIDGTNKGELPQIAESPDPSSTTQRTKALYMPLKSGTYKVEAKRANGTVVSSNKMTFTTNKMGCSGGIGGASAAADNNQEYIMVELF